MPKVEVNDIQMYYEVNGEGYPLVMIMGWQGNLDWWNPHMIEELSKNFKVVTFDNRGTGRTDVSEKEFSIRLFVDDTVGLMNVLGIFKASIKPAVSSANNLIVYSLLDKSVRPAPLLSNMTVLKFLESSSIM